MINRWVGVGRLTKSPELKYTQSGIAVCRFTLACNRPFKGQDGKNEADFINCVAWRKQAENVANYLHKGSLAGIEGRIQTSNFEGKDGNRVFLTEVVADSVQFLEPKGTNNQQNQNNGYQQQGNMQNNAPNNAHNGNYGQQGTNTQNYNQNANTVQQGMNNGVQNDPFTGGGQVVVNDDDLPF